MEVTSSDKSGFDEGKGGKNNLKAFAVMLMRDVSGLEESGNNGSEQKQVDFSYVLETKRRTLCGSLTVVDEGRKEVSVSRSGCQE